MGEIKITTNPTKNRLSITLSGFFRASDSEALFPELEKALDTLEPGFDVITDISGFVPASPEVARSLRRGGELVKARGRRRAVRVVGKLVLGLMQFKRELDGVFDDASTRYAKSLTEAEQILDDWK